MFMAPGGYRSKTDPSNFAIWVCRLLILERIHFLKKITETCCFGLDLWCIGSINGLGPLVASTGHVLVRCWQHQTSTGPVLAPTGMFTGLVIESALVFISSSFRCRQTNFTCKSSHCTSNALWMIKMSKIVTYVSDTYVTLRLQNNNQMYII